MKRFSFLSIYHRAGVGAAALALGGVFCAASSVATATDDSRLRAVAVKESYKLPISPPLDQGESDLCWVYATLSMLESNYLARHPGSTIQLSRAALQRASIADRFHRQITGDSDHLEDGGVAVDALKLISQHGIVADKDFHGVVDSDPVWENVAERIAEVDSQEGKLAALNSAIAGELGVAPEKTNLDGQELTPRQVAKAVLGDNVWAEYDVTPDGPPRTGPSTDPDARPGTEAHYVTRPTAIDLIHKSLARGQAVVWGSSDHALLIYGGEYDATGRPLAYWIKDSLAPYTYLAPAEEMHEEMTDVTVTAPPTQERASTARTN